MVNGNEKVPNNFEEKPTSSTNDTANHRHYHHQALHMRSLISSKSIAPNSGQMFLILRRSSSLIALLVVVISSMLTTLSPDGRGVDAGLIQIYHKYKAGKAAESPSAADTSEDSLNSSAAIEQSILDDEQVVDLIPEPSSRSIEYTSPMKRIMELIGHHSPVIVVSSESSSQQPTMNPSQTIEQQMVGNGGQQQMISSSNKGAENPMATFVQTALLPANHMQPQAQPATSSPEHQQWTLMDSNQALMPSAMLASPQQHHQQFIQTAAIPAYEQYYLAPSHQLSADHAAQTHHLAMMPNANLGFSPANSYQQIASMSPSFSPASEAHHQAAQQAAASFQAAQQSMQQHKNLEDRAQPVFLSSYVPEITVPAKSVMQPEVPVEKRPDSIQQAVQYSQDSQQQKQQPQQQQQQQPIQTQASSSPTLTPSAGNTMQKVPVAQARSSSQPAEANNDSSSSSDNDMADEGDSDSRGGNSDESEDGDSSGDIEEPSKIKRSHTAERQAQGSQARQLTTPNKTNSKGSDGDSGNQEDPSSGGNGSGYMSYEDKYDSDKDEPRSVSTSHSPRAAEANEIVANGLINVGLNDDCLQCICRASSGCDQLLRCITRGSEEKYCGPFQLTEEYWNMAGKPKDDNSNFQSFEDCANEVECAVETVTNYMKKYHKDCDGDENITCMDYARLHRLKPDECGNTKKLANSFDAYWAKFQRCAEGYNRSRTGDDEEI